MNISEAVNSTATVAAASIAGFEAFIKPIDPIPVIVIFFLLGVVLGLFYGKKKGIKDFFKMPAAHFRIRGR